MEHASERGDYCRRNYRHVWAILRKASKKGSMPMKTLNNYKTEISAISKANGNVDIGVAQIYYNLIKKGLKTIDDVPLKWREEVRQY